MNNQTISLFLDHLKDCYNNDGMLTINMQTVFGNSLCSGKPVFVSDEDYEIMTEDGNYEFNPDFTKIDDVRYDEDECEFEFISGENVIHITFI